MSGQRSYLQGMPLRAFVAHLPEDQQEEELARMVEAGRPRKPNRANRSQRRESAARRGRSR